MITIDKIWREILNKRKQIKSINCSKSGSFTRKIKTMATWSLMRLKKLLISANRKLLVKLKEKLRKTWRRNKELLLKS